MNLVTLEKVSKQYGERLLLDTVDLLINSGERIALLGRNGSGKTTLLRLIAGEEQPDAGRLTIWGKVRVRYLPQDPYLNPDLTVLETVFSGEAPHLQRLRDYEQAVGRLAQRPGDPALQARLHDLTAEMDRTGGWAAEASAKAILTRLGITDFQQKAGTLSGGQARRLALAQALIDPGDLLILDEPTNHIDAETVAWLEQHLVDSAAAVLMVTHDRYFLENVATRIVELDRRKLISYAGNYSRYLEGRAAREEQLQAAEEKRAAWLRRELDWLRRGAQARSTKQKARKQRVEELLTLKYDSGSERVALSLASRRLGKRVLEAGGLAKTLGGQTLFQALDFSLFPGDRVGLVGPNGAGKTTLLNILAGKLAPDSGQLTWGETVELGYFDQLNEALEGEDRTRVVDFIEARAPLITTAEGERITAPQMLEWFLFPRPEQRTRIGSLSGGERRRLVLLHSLIRRPNVLLLDEPTNDLDIQTLAVLEEFLDHFKGCLIVVSHDRYFLDRNVDYIMPFDGGVLGTRYPSPYRFQPTTSPSPAGPSPQSTLPRPVAPKPPATPPLSWKERREFERLEDLIEALEREIGRLEEEINGAGGDYQQLEALTAELETANHRLEKTMARWLELADRAG